MFAKLTLLLLSILSFSVEAQTFGTNTGVFADYFPSFALNQVPFRYPGQYGAGYNAAPAGTYSGSDPILFGPASIWSNADNYPTSSGYKLEFDAPNPAAISVQVAGMYTNLTTASIVGNHYIGYFTITHDNGNRQAGGGQVSFANPSPSNPVSHMMVTVPGGVIGELTNQYKNYLQPYQAIRWMNNNFINDNTKVMTAVDLVPSGSNFYGNSYDDIIHAANEQSSLQKFWINIPTFADDAFLIGMAKKLENISPGKKIVVELSNEPWNFGFKQQNAIYNRAVSDRRTINTDVYGRTGEEYGLMAAHAMQTIINQFTSDGKNPAILEGFLNSQGSNTWFSQQSKDAINRVFPGQLNTFFKYQGISFYPCDNLTSVSTVDALFTSLYADLQRQKQYLADDKKAATLSGLGEAIYEWGPNGYLTQSGINQALIDQFRADPRSEQWVLDEWAAIKSVLGPNDMAMEFTNLGDNWSAQIDPLGPVEYEHQAILQISASTPEPSSMLFMLVLFFLLFIRR